MSQNDLKKRIKDKYRSLSKFCRLSGYDEAKLRLLLAVKYPDAEELARVNRLLNKIMNGGDPAYLSQDMIDAISNKIETKYGTVTDFCASHKQFADKAGSIYHIRKGRAKRVNKFVKELCKTLKVKI